MKKVLSRKKVAIPEWALAPASTGGQERVAAPTPIEVTGELLFWRSRVAKWPDNWRERWGLRANALEDQGLGWRRAEEQAFEEIREERDA